MAKSQDAKKSAKKEPLKTAKEKKETRANDLVNDVISLELAIDTYKKDGSGKWEGGSTCSDEKNRVSTVWQRIEQFSHI